MFSRGATCNPNLYTINSDGSGEARVTADPAGDGLDPTWSADGTRLVFEGSSQCPDQICNREIYVMNVDGTGRIRLTNDSRPDYDPTWSPAGDRVAWVRELATPNTACGAMTDIISQNPYSTGWTRQTFSNHSESDVDWEPSGYTLSFTVFEFYPDEYCEASFPGQMGLWTLSGPVNSTPTYGADYSPDGRAWVARGNGAYLQLIGNPSPGSVTATAVGGTPGCCPVWSPDGAQIAWLRDGDIWIMNVDGSNQHPITSTPEPEGQLDWQAVQGHYVRPAGATPMRVSLVPAFEQCASSNRTHGPPLAFPRATRPSPRRPTSR